MNYKDLEVSADETHFLYKDEIAFEGKIFAQVLKFHAEGLAAVADKEGWYHLNLAGAAAYEQRYNRTFGYYFERAAVVDFAQNWFHIDTQGRRVYAQDYSWVGNYQQARCVVRDKNNRYFHIDLSGKAIYTEQYLYVGDYKDGLACAHSAPKHCRHIDLSGAPIYAHDFEDLGVFHKSYATAKDGEGWFHINRAGAAQYAERYAAVEPFYNGFALVQTQADDKIIIDEKGRQILKI